MYSQCIATLGLHWVHYSVCTVHTRVYVQCIHWLTLAWGLHTFYCYFDAECEANGRTCVVGFGRGSCSSEASRRCSGLNKHVNFGFCLFLTGVRVVPEPRDTSTTNAVSLSFGKLTRPDSSANVFLKGKGHLFKHMGFLVPIESCLPTVLMKQWMLGIAPNFQGMFLRKCVTCLYQNIHNFEKVTFGL